MLIINCNLPKYRKGFGRKPVAELQDFQRETPDAGIREIAGFRLAR